FPSERDMDPISFPITAAVENTEHSNYRNGHRHWSWWLACSKWPGSESWISTRTSGQLPPLSTYYLVAIDSFHSGSCLMYRRDTTRHPRPARSPGCLRVDNRRCRLCRILDLLYQPFCRYRI